MLIHLLFIWRGSYFATLVQCCKCWFCEFWLNRPVTFGTILMSPFLTMSFSLPPSVRIKEDHVIQHGLVVDGTSLSLALRQHEKLFMEVCRNCPAVLCCRMAPLQKAKVMPCRFGLEARVSLAFLCQKFLPWLPETSSAFKIGWCAKEPLNCLSNGDSELFLIFFKKILISFLGCATVKNLSREAYHVSYWWRG